MDIVESYKKEPIITLQHYVYLFLTIISILIIDIFVFQEISMLALYSVPLGVAGIYFPRLFACAVGILVWLLGLLDELHYLSTTDLISRYIAIAILFLVILSITFKLANQTKSLQKNNLELKALVLSIVLALSSAIEAKDIYLKGHSSNVASLSTKIARKLKLNEREVTNINYAALLHDIGKIGISEIILNKPGRLTEEEYACVKAHSEIGANIVSQVKEFKPFVKYILSHHERWDGLGYPKGLKEEEIPLGSRIISVADAYDAIVSKRSYRRPLAVQEAIEEIKRGSGTQFDPKVVSAFLEILDTKENSEREKLHLSAS